MLLSSHTSTHRSSQPTRGAALTGGAKVDVCICGSSLADALAAYFLAREKRHVMLLHDGPLGMHGAPELVHLSTLIEEPYEALERKHGPENARLAAQSYAAALDALEAIVRRERIACELERLDGYRHCADAADAEREVEAAHRAGAEAVEIATAPPVEGGPPRGWVRYPGQVQFNASKLVEGLSKAITREGGRIHNGVRARALEPGHPSILVTSAGHRIEAEFVVMPGRRPEPAVIANGVALRLRRGVATRALYWKCGDDTQCGARLRTAPGAETLLVAGNETSEALVAWARQMFPQVGEPVQQFQGEMPVACDLFALTGLGAEPDGVYASTSSWGSAITRAVVAGMAIRDFVVGARVPEPDAAASPNPGLTTALD